MSSMKQGGACGGTAGGCEGEKLSVIGDICMNFCLIRSLNTQPHNLFVVTHSAKEDTTNSHQDKRNFRMERNPSPKLSVFSLLHENKDLFELEEHTL